MYCFALCIVGSYDIVSVGEVSNNYTFVWCRIVATKTWNDEKLLLFFYCIVLRFIMLKVSSFSVE